MALTDKVLEKQIIELYMTGKTIDEIIVEMNLPYKKVMELLEQYKYRNTTSGKYSDELKAVIAKRCENGVSCKQVANELEIGYKKVREIHKKNQNKDKDIILESLYTKLEGDFSYDKCPTCGSKKVNEVGVKTTYCLKCGNEHIFRKGYVLRINWEYVD